MRQYIDLETIKNHLNIDSWYHADDALLITYLGIAQDTVAKNIDDDLVNLENDDNELPDGLVGALLLYIGLLYNDREAVNHTNNQELPLGFKYLLDMYRNYNRSNKNNSSNCCC